MGGALLGVATLLALLGAGGALSTCRSLDLEAARRKRIEAVRGQILSKLRLTAPPPADPPPPQQLPEDVRALYNSTSELLRQQAMLRPPDEPDEYWAKELHRFPMEPLADGPLERWRPTSRSTFFVFNTSRVRAEVGHEALLHRAELRMLRQRASAENLGLEQRLELYQT
ncbi:transforming growth factor beta-1 proprotein [Mergus octosetaceus]